MSVQRAFQLAQILRARQRELEYRGAQQFALRVDAQGLACAPTQRIVQEEVEGEEFRQLEPFDSRGRERIKKISHALGGQLAPEKLETGFGICRHADVGVIALVAATGVSNLAESDGVWCGGHALFDVILWRLLRPLPIRMRIELPRRAGPVVWEPAWANRQTPDARNCGRLHSRPVRAVRS